MEQQKIKWHYDKKFKQWYVNETIAYGNDGFQICHDSNRYVLTGDIFGSKLYFNKLSSAKQVANLLRHG